MLYCITLVSQFHGYQPGEDIPSFEGLAWGYGPTTQGPYEKLNVGMGCLPMVLHVCT